MQTAVGFIWSAWSNLNGPDARQLDHLSRHGKAQLDAIRLYCLNHDLKLIRTFASPYTSRDEATIGHDLSALESALSECPPAVLVYCNVQRYRPSLPIRARISDAIKRYKPGIVHVIKVDGDEAMEGREVGELLRTEARQRKEALAEKRDHNRRSKAIRSGIAERDIQLRNQFSAELKQLSKQGHSNSVIAKRLNEMGYRTTRDKAWTTETVRLERKRVVALKSKK